MARVVWDRVGQRRFHTGVDRGVLYPQGSTTGVPWNGLTAVNEGPTGGEAKALYLDGYKYMNKASREEFEGSIEAFTYPSEFEACEGNSDLGRGLYLSQQRRKSFGLCYRTLIGNDLDGVDHGYRLHLVYNALAQASSKNNASLSSSPEASSFNWSFTTKAIRVAGHRPVAHIVIDSTKTQQSLLIAMEDILYGSSSTAPRIPPPSEVLTLFTAWPELQIIINGDGTFTVDGPDSIVSLLNATTFQITADTVTIDGQVYTATSA